MMTIKINFINNDYTITRINGTLEEIAKYYFPRKEVKNIEILEGGEFENEFYKQTPLSIYRITEQERLKEFLQCDKLKELKRLVFTTTKSARKKRAFRAGQFRPLLLPKNREKRVKI